MKHERENRSVFCSWLASYFLILLIPTAISGIVYLRSVAIFKTEIIETNKVLLTQLQQAFDGQIQDVERFALQIAMNSKLHRVLDIKSREELYSSYSEVSNVLEMNADFNVYATVNGNIQSFYIVFSEQDIIWADSTIFSKEDFFRSMGSGSKVTYKQWLKIVEKQYVGNYIFLHAFKTHGQVNQSIAFIQSIPIGGTAHKANLVVMIDQSRLNQALQNINRLQKGSVYIIDRENHILFDNLGTPWPLPVLRYQQMGANVGLLDTVQNDEKVKISYISSQVTDWKYVYAIPASLFEEKLSTLKKLTLFGMLFCVFIGGTLVVWLVKHNYSPLHDVLGLLRNIKLMPESSHENNEFKLIQHSIYQVYHENEVINRRLMQQNETIRSHFLVRLLQGRLENHASETVENYGIKFISDRFLVMLIYIDDYQPLKPGESEQELITGMEQIQRALGSLLQERLKTIGLIFQLEYNEMIVGILNTRSDLAGEWQVLIGDLLAQTQAWVEKRFGLSCSMAVSGIHETLKGICPAYQEAMDAMEYHLFEGREHSLLFYDQVQQLGSENYNYYYSMETEQKLINSIRVGDLQQAANLVEMVFTDFTTGTAEIKLAKWMMFDIIGTVIRTLNGEGLLMECQFVTGKDRMKQLLECKNFDEIKQGIKLILEEACALIGQRRKSGGKNDHLVTKIDRIIEECYHDLNMSLTQLAGELRMNPKYLSAIYKEATGVSIVDRLNQMRVTVAKRLLRETPLGIAEIATKVGYCNSNALIRAFKRVEGITPGQFKELK